MNGNNIKVQRYWPRLVFAFDISLQIDIVLISSVTDSSWCHITIFLKGLFIAFFSFLQIIIIFCSSKHMSSLSIQVLPYLPISPIALQTPLPAEKHPLHVPLPGARLGVLWCVVDQLLLWEARELQLELRGPVHPDPGRGGGLQPHGG